MSLAVHPAFVTVGMFFIAIASMQIALDGRWKTTAIANVRITNIIKMRTVFAFIGHKLHLVGGTRLPQRPPALYINSVFLLPFIKFGLFAVPIRFGTVIYFLLSWLFIFRFGHIAPFG